jgi:hypothetical protein
MECAHVRVGVCFHLQPELMVPVGIAELKPATQMHEPDTKTANPDTEGGIESDLHENELLFLVVVEGVVYHKVIFERPTSKMSRVSYSYIITYIIVYVNVFEYLNH